MAGPTTARRGDEDPSQPPLAGPPPEVDPENPQGPLAEGEGRESGAPRPGPRLRVRLRRPGRRTVVLALVLAVLLSAFGVWALYGSTWLRAERVTVTGAGVLTPGEVERAAAVPMGAPLASVDTEATARRVAEKLPRVKSVEVMRSWPNTIGLKVIERRPVVLLESGGKFTEVDAEGVRFATVDTAPKNVPRLEMTPVASPSLREYGVQRLRRAAVAVAADVPGTVRKDVRAIVVRSYDAISLELTGGRRVEWGSEERGAAKGRVLRALLEAADDASHFDVSVPSAPAVSAS